MEGLITTAANPFPDGPSSRTEVTPIQDQSTGKKGLTIAVEPLHGEWTLPMRHVWDPWLQKGKDQKVLEKVSFRECSTGDGTEVGSCRSPARESSHGSVWN